MPAPAYSTVDAHEITLWLRPPPASVIDLLPQLPSVVRTLLCRNSIATDNIEYAPFIQSNDLWTSPSLIINLIRPVQGTIWASWAKIVDTYHLSFRIHGLANNANVAFYKLLRIPMAPQVEPPPSITDIVAETHLQRAERMAVAVRAEETERRFQAARWVPRPRPLPTTHERANAYQTLLEATEPLPEIVENTITEEQQRMLDAFSVAVEGAEERMTPSQRNVEAALARTLRDSGRLDIRTNRESHENYDYEDDDEAMSLGAEEPGSAEDTEPVAPAIPIPALERDLNVGKPFRVIDLD